jgi:hypothetical protein
MSAPEYVPTKPAVPVRSYESPPRRPEPWLPDRPGELVGRGRGDEPDGQPRGRRLGNPGPDPGYVYRLVNRFKDKVVLARGESWEDAAAGAAGVALKRASLFGRAPVVHDVTVGFGVWGFLDEAPPGELVELRRTAFGAISHPADYTRLRQVVDAVPERALRLPHAELLRRRPSDWQQFLELEQVGAH